MGIGNGILNMLGRRLESSRRGQFESLTRVIFAKFPIDAVEEMYDLFGRGGIIETLIMQGLSREEAQQAEYELEYRVAETFKSAKAGKPGSPSDRTARAMATNIAAAFAKRGPIEVVIGLCETLNEVVKSNRVIKGTELTALYEEGLERASRSPSVRDRYAQSA